MSRIGQCPRPMATRCARGPDCKAKTRRPLEQRYARVAAGRNFFNICALASRAIGLGLRVAIVSAEDHRTPIHFASGGIVGGLRPATVSARQTQVESHL